MKKSKAVTMAVLGTAFLSGCTMDPAEVLKSEHRDAEIKQNLYSSKSDCEKDWGNGSSDCKERTGGGGYYGPHYFWSHYNNRPYVVDQDGGLRPAPTAYSGLGVSPNAKSSTTVRAGVARGGFGSTAHGFSAGG